MSRKGKYTRRTSYIHIGSIASGAFYDRCRKPVVGKYKPWGREIRSLRGFWMLAIHSNPKRKVK